MNREELKRRAKEVFEKYKYALMILLAGAILLLLPLGEEKREAAPENEGQGAGEELITSWTGLEERMERALSQIEGAGEVRVVLTLKEGPRQVLAQEGKVGENSHETSTVLVNQGSGVQEAVKVQELGPSYQGALVVAQGAEDPEVRLALSQAVSALTGLGADKITICKGK